MQYTGTGPEELRTESSPGYCQIRLSYGTGTSGCGVLGFDALNVHVLQEIRKQIILFRRGTGVPRLFFVLRRLQALLAERRICFLRLCGRSRRTGGAKADRLCGLSAVIRKIYKLPIEIPG